MKRLLERMEHTANQIENHQFAQLMDHASPQELLGVMRSLTNTFIHLTMTFRDINTLYFMYDAPGNPMERMVDAHAREDAEHWRMILHDLNALSLNVEQCVSDSMLDFWQDANLFAREYIYSVLTRARRCSENHLWRMAAMEAAEVGVRVFLEIINRNTQRMCHELDIELVYFGKKHLVTEVDTQLETSPFEEIVLKEEDFTFCAAIAEEHLADNKVFMNGLADSVAKALHKMRSLTMA